MNSLLLNPALYGWQHITYLIFFIAVTVTLCLVTKFFIKTDKQKLILIKSVAGVLLVFILMNRISIAVRFKDVWMFIPNSYCGLTSLLLSLVVLFGKPNMKAYHCLWYLGLVGGIATMFYPDFLGQHPSFMYIPTISGLLHHSVLLILVILLAQTKWFTPELKCWKYFPLGFCGYIIFGLFCMSIFGWGNAMEINGSLIEGTPLNWWFILIVGSALLFVVLFAMEWIKKRSFKEAFKTLLPQKANSNLNENSENKEND